jgi:hypothetical protein
MKSLLFSFSEMKSSLFFFLNEFIIFLLVFARKAMNTSGEMKSFSFHEHPVTELARRQPPHQQSITRQHGTRRQPSSYRTRSDGTLPSTSAATAARCSAVRFDSVASSSLAAPMGSGFRCHLKPKPHRPQPPPPPTRGLERRQTEGRACVPRPRSVRAIHAPADTTCGLPWRRRRPWAPRASSRWVRVGLTGTARPPPPPHARADSAASWAAGASRS